MQYAIIIVIKKVTKKDQIRSLGPPAHRPVEKE